MRSGTRRSWSTPSSVSSARRVFGICKLWRMIHRAGHHLGDQVARLMGISGNHGVVRGRHTTRTTERNATATPPLLSPLRRPHPQRERHRSAELPAPRLHPEPHLARDRPTRRAAHRLAATTGPCTARSRCVGTETTAAQAVRNRRPPRPTRAPNPPTPTRPRALSTPAHRSDRPTTQRRPDRPAPRADNHPGSGPTQAARHAARTPTPTPVRRSK